MMSSVVDVAFQPNILKKLYDQDSRRVVMEVDNR